LKQDVSINNPSAEELARYGMSRHVISGEQPLWFGIPNVRYAFLLGSPTTFLFAALFVGFWRLKFGLEYEGSGVEARAMIVFDAIIVFVLAFDCLIINSLRGVSYLITDRRLLITLKSVWYIKILYNARRAIRNHNGRVLSYNLENIGNFKTRKSLLNSKIGNIYLESGILTDRTVYMGRNDGKVGFRFKRFPIQFSTQLKLANVMYAITNVAAVSALLCSAINNRIEEVGDLI